MSNASAGIAIFVKTPGISPLKTRLAATEGVEYAESWYRRAAAAVAETAQDSGAEVYWAVAEPEGMEAEIWRDLPRISQLSTTTFTSAHARLRNASLGARMHCVQQQLLARHPAAIFLGADTPHLDISVLHAVLEYLRDSTPRWAVAPASDGGFWLHGANRAAPLSAWDSVPYSCADTLAQFVLAMGDQGELARFQSETDVDTAADLTACASALTRLRQPTEKQRTLLNWMREQRLNEGARTLENPETNS